MTEAPPPVSAARLGTWIICLVTAMFAVRMAAPSDLIDFGQEAPVAYTLDAIKNGHWIAQLDAEGEVMSKPPLYNWFTALGALVGEVNRFTLCLPAFLSTLALSLVIFFFGQAYFGWRAGFGAAWIYALSPVAAKQVALARGDGLFSLMVALGACAAWRSWFTGKGWTCFWLAGAAATLTKGPLGVLLAGVGLLAALWEKSSGRSAPVKGAHWAGLVVFLAVVGGWFLLAYLEFGQPLVDKMLVRELYEHAVDRGDGRVAGRGFHLPTLYFLSRFAPWSLFSLLGFWRVYRRSAAEATERQVERFLFCWFLAGLVIFSLAAHQRPDLIFPLVPAAALLGGREIARLLQKRTDHQFFQLAGGVGLLALILTGTQYAVLRKTVDGVAQTHAAKKLAESVIKQAGRGFPLVHVDSSPVLQMYLDAFNPNVSWERAKNLLDGPAAVFVAVRNLDTVLPQLNTNSVYVLAESARTRRSHAAIIGNRPALGWIDPLVTIIGPLRVEMSGVHQMIRAANWFAFLGEATASAALTNESEKPQTVWVQFIEPAYFSPVNVSLAPGETKRIRGAREF